MTDLSSVHSGCLQRKRLMLFASRLDVDEIAFESLLQFNQIPPSNSPLNTHISSSSSISNLSTAFEVIGDLGPPLNFESAELYKKSHFCYSSKIDFKEFERLYFDLKVSAFQKSQKTNFLLPLAEKLRESFNSTYFDHMVIKIN